MNDDNQTAKELKGRIALVTGASRGIGRAIALALAKAGADVAVNFRARGAEAKAVCAEIERSVHRSLAVQADMAIAKEVSRLVKTVQQDLGDVDILVNNAGISRPQPLQEITERDWDEVLTINLKSMFLMTQAVLPGMRKRHWGRIINLSSVAAQLGGIIGAHYAASEAGVLGLTHSYAALLATEGITVNAIAPVLIGTEMVTSNPKARPELIPVGRMGTAEEVAEVVVMLAKNGYITGQTINVNGGWYMAFIYYYAKIHGVPPAEADIQRYFQTLPPAIHQMVVTLEKRGFIGRVPGQARSIKLRLTRNQLPDLE